MLVAAAGNNNSENISYPARFENVIAAAALENEEKMAASNYGKEIDFAASGIIEITQRHYLPALNFSRKYKLKGTSFAAPQISGLIADLLTLNPKLDIKTALLIISDTAQTLNDPLFAEQKLGAGKINRFKALSRANSYYFWLQLAIYISLTIISSLFYYICWQKYSLTGIFIFIIISGLIFLLQPFLLLLYYHFRFFKILFFTLSLAVFYIIILKLLSFYIKNSTNFALLLKVGPYLNNKLQTQLNKKIRMSLNHNSKIEQKFKKYMISSLQNSHSQKKINFYLKHAAALKQPPVKLIIEKTLSYKIPAQKVVANFNLEQKNLKEQFIIIAELLTIIFNENYSKKKKAAEIAAELDSALILNPIKNTLKKRRQLEITAPTLYFLLDIVAAFALKAADFSSLLQEIILENSSPWLKFHALEAYLEVGINDLNYQEFIKKIKAKEKEPVLLALKKINLI